MLKIVSINDIKILSALVSRFRNFDLPSEEDNLEKLNEYLSAVLTQGKTQILLFEIEEKIVGYASICIYDSLTDMEKQIYVDELFISGEYQNKGAGSLFLSEIRDWSKAIGATKLKLVTRPDNLRAQHFYEKNLGIKKDKINYTFLLE